MTEATPLADRLFEAVHSGDSAAAAAALDAGAATTARDTDDWSPLDWAAGRGDETMVRLLLDRGADPTATGADGRTAYEIALAAGHVAAARVLREAEELADPAAAERHVWRPYCKAYPLGRLRVAPMWTDEADDLADDTIVFVHDDYSVTRSIWPGEDVLLASPTSDWIMFCRNDLDFRVPDDFDLVPPAQSMGSS